MICYLESKNDTVLKICSAEKFIELTEDQRTAVLIDAYRSGQNPGAKQMLPAFVFQGYDPALLEGRQGSRKKSALKPTGLVMHDFDHISLTPDPSPTGEGSKMTPQMVYDRFLAAMPKLGLTLEDDLALAHITPSGDGLRLVLRSRKNRDVAEDQRWIADALRVECDVHVKDLSRLSFVPKREDILYLNKSLLFASIEPYAKAHEVSSQPAIHTMNCVVADGNVAPQQADAQADAATPSFPECYNGIPYKRIVEELITVHGGQPQIGNRENTLFLIAGDMAKITDRSQAWLETLLPTFGLPEEEWRQTIAQVCKKPMEHGLSRKLKEVISSLTPLYPLSEGQEGVDSPEGNQELSPSWGDQEGGCPAMPEHLPSLVQLLTSKVMPHQRAAVATMVFPALATHVNNCQFKFLDNTESELSLMSCLLAPQSVGKSCVKAPLREIMADIKAEDTINRQREHDWQESQKNKKANEKGKSRPEDIVIRILSSDTTPAAFLGRLSAAEHGDGNRLNLCTYSQVDEIEDLYRFCSGGGKNYINQMIKRSWDRDDIGAERWSANSANISTILRWNWAASSTIEGGKKFFHNCLTDGTTSRVDFCTIIPPQGRIRFRYGDYDQTFREELKPYIDNLKRYTCATDENGNLIPSTIPEAMELGEQLVEYTENKAATMPDDTWRNYAWRTVVMVLKKVIVLYIANGCQWEETFAPFAWWSFHYSMWCKMNLFYDTASAKFEEEKLHSNRGQRSPLKSMKPTFVYSDFAAECQKQGLRGDPRNLLRKFKFRGVIIQQGDQYTIAPEYCKKNGIL